MMSVTLKPGAEKGEQTKDIRYRNGTIADQHHLEIAAMHLQD